MRKAILCLIGLILVASTFSLGLTVAVRAQSGVNLTPKEVYINTQTCTPKVRFEARGLTETLAVDVHLYIDGNFYGYLTTQVLAGDVRDVLVDFDVYSSCDAGTMEAVIDPDNKIQEVNEGDNSLFVDYTLPTATPPSPTATSTPTPTIIYLPTATATPPATETPSPMPTPTVTPTIIYVPRAYISYEVVTATVVVSLTADVGWHLYLDGGFVRAGGENPFTFDLDDFQESFEVVSNPGSTIEEKMFVRKDELFKLFAPLVAR